MRGTLSYLDLMYAAKDCSIPGGYGYDINAKVSGFLQDTNVFVKSGVGL